MLKNISTKKLFIFDLDGTVTESKSKISPEMGALLSELLKTKKVAIISGGKFDQFKKQFLAGLKANTNFANLSLFPTNSTTLYSRRKSGWQKKYEERLNLKEKKEIISSLKKLQLSPIYNKPTKTYGPIIENRGTQITMSAIGQLAPVSEKKKWNKLNDRRSSYIAFLKKYLRNFEIKKGGLTSIDITRKGIDKAYGVKKILKELEILKKDAVFIGDAFYRGGNDAPAKRTGIDCIKVNGPEETKKIILSSIT